jgi:glycosyltransferase involved in cell wall biosynthesis
MSAELASAADALPAGHHRACAPQVGEKLRILFMADASSVHTRRWVAAAVERGAEAVVITRVSAEVPGAQEVISLAPGSDKLGWFLAVPSLRKLVRELVQRFNPHVVHGHYVTSYGMWAAACGLDRPTVLTAWGSDILVTPRESRLMHAVVGWSLRHADLITADSLDMLDEIARYHPPAPGHQILWGADTDRFTPAQPAPGFELVSLRSWEPNYNIDVILRAFAQLLAQRPQAQARLHLLGGGSQADALKALIAQLQLQDQVVLHGRVGDQAMVDAIQRSRVSVSVPASDATSVSVLESMSCGLPIIASDLPANRQWLDARGGWLVPAGDVAALARVMLQAFDQQDQAQAMGEHNRALVVREASRRGQMDAMWRLYQKLLLPCVPRRERPRPLAR